MILLRTIASSNVIRPQDDVLIEGISPSKRVVRAQARSAAARRRPRQLARASRSEHLSRLPIVHGATNADAPVVAQGQSRIASRVFNNDILLRGRAFEGYGLIKGHVLLKSVIPSERVVCARSDARRGEN